MSYKIYWENYYKSYATPQRESRFDVRGGGYNPFCTSFLDSKNPLSLSNFTIHRAYFNIYWESSVMSKCFSHFLANIFSLHFIYSLRSDENFLTQITESWLTQDVAPAYVGIESAFCILSIWILYIRLSKCAFWCKKSKYARQSNEGNFYQKSKEQK